MPYPIAKLAYGLRCRLSDLTTLVERYHLQVAAGSFSICPPKHQKIRLTNISSPMFRCINGTDSMYCEVYSSWKGQTFVVNEDDLIKIISLVYLMNIDQQSLKSDTFSHFLFKSTSTTLEYCTLSKPFFELIKTTFPKMERMNVYRRVDASSVVNFTDLLTTLPNLKTLHTTYHISDNWMNEIRQASNHSLRELRIEFNNRTQCQLNFEEFVTFLKTQRQGFELYIMWRANETAYDFYLLQQYLNQKLNKNFECAKQEKLTQVTIECDMKHLWYVHLP